MFQKILVADRDQAALRIMRAARELGVQTVAVYSTEDAASYHVRYADQAVCIGPADALKSYCSVPNIVEAAKTTGAEAIHPGFGYLGRDADFARACADNDLVFIGPAAESVRRFADRLSARAVMRACGVPLVPASDDVVRSVEEAFAVARRLGFPVLVKSVVGGPQGRVVREVPNSSVLEEVFAEASGQAVKMAEVLGDPDAADVYIEKSMAGMRHIEVQAVADAFGNRVALCERDCSIQRAGRLLVAEAPSPAVSDGLRRALGVAAIKAVRALDYCGALTVKFLLAPDDRFYFFGASPCAEDQQGATEAITGVDLVKEQIRIAAGEPMTCVSRAPFMPFGHAMQLFVYARDVEDGFRACAGTARHVEMPSGLGLRAETCLRDGSRVSPCYDPTAAVLVVLGQDRQEAIARGRRAVDELKIEGIKTTRSFHRRVLDNAVFCAGEATTDFVETQMGDLK